MKDIVINAEMHAEDRRNITYRSPADLQENLFDSIGHSIVEMSGLVKKGDLVIFVAGAPSSEKSRTSWTRFEVM